MEEEKMLTLEKFEEASEVVRRVTLETNLYTVIILASRPVQRYFLSRKTCSSPVHTR